MSANERIKDKLDRIEQKLNNIDVTLAVNTQSLQEHMRRTDLLEQKLEPVEKHVAMLQGGLKLLGLISLLVGVAVGISKLR